MSQRYTSKQDAIEQDIIPALGEFADDHDVDGIFAAAYDYRVDHDSNGNELLNSAGFEQVVTTDEFWTIAEQHAR